MRTLSPDVRDAMAFAIPLALLLGAVVAVGAHLSNAFPSESRPFGWTGPAAFENAVAMVRDELVLAVTVPAIMLGARAAMRADERSDGPLRVFGAFCLHAGALTLGVIAAGGLGAWAAFKTPGGAYMAFVVAHGLLAWAFLAIGLLMGVTFRKAAVAAAVAAWGVLVLLYDNVLQWRVFREAGYERLAAGDFPSWFWAAQALSPFTAYKGILILWRARFRTYLEKAVLDGADLPGWMTPVTFSGLLVALWAALPVALACGIVAVRRRAADGNALLPFATRPRRTAQRR